MPGETLNPEAQAAVEKDQLVTLQEAGYRNQFDDLEPAARKEAIDTERARIKKGLESLADVGINMPENHDQGKVYLAGLEALTRLEAK